MRAWRGAHLDRTRETLPYFCWRRVVVQSSLDKRLPPPEARCPTELLEFLEVLLIFPPCFLAS